VNGERVYTPPAGIDHPPFPPLLEMLERLRAQGLPHALGASGLLAALGLIREVNDWDVTVDAPIEKVEAACAGLEFSWHGHSGCHADHKLGFERERIELIADFAFFVPGGIVRIPTVVTGTWQGIPVGSPAAWAAAYALMGELDGDARRRERAELLFAWLASGPAEPDASARLLAQPLPEELARRLADLPR
jgi:hypothetical protein